MMDLKSISTLQLLRRHGAILDELLRRDVLRSSNGPISDYAELRFCSAFGWTRERNSKSGYDATDIECKRFQIKARRITRAPGSRQLGAIRKLDTTPFDQLAALLFKSDFSVHRAALIPVEVVTARVRRSAHTNSHVLHLNDDIWTLPGVIDVTQRIEIVSATFE